MPMTRGSMMGSLPKVAVGRHLSSESVNLENYRSSVGDTLIAEMLPEDYDLFIVHDPQPAALRHFKKSLPRSKWIWRCHIDSSEPNQEVWEFLHPYIQEYDAAVFTMKAFQPSDLGVGRVVFI